MFAFFRSRVQHTARCAGAPPPALPLVAARQLHDAPAGMQALPSGCCVKTRLLGRCNSVEGKFHVEVPADTRHAPRVAPRARFASRISAHRWALARRFANPAAAFSSTSFPLSLASHLTRTAVAAACPAASASSRTTASSARSRAARSARASEGGRCCPHPTGVLRGGGGATAYLRDRAEPKS